MRITSLALALAIGMSSTLLAADAMVVAPEFDGTIYNLKQWKIENGGNDHWYAIRVVPLHWNDADSAARTFVLGNDTGYLATVASAAENDFIKDSALFGMGAVCGYVWLGGQRATCEGPWSWIMQEPLSFQRWDFFGYQPDFSAMAMNGPCWTNPSRFGKWSAWDPTGEWMSDHWYQSVIEWGSYNPVPVEPVVANVIRTATWDTADGGNGNTYAIVATRLSWVKADSMARTLLLGNDTGFLASIHSAAENEFVKNLLVGPENQVTDEGAFEDVYWLGARDLFDENWTYPRWSTHEPFSYYSSGWPGTSGDWPPKGVGIRGAHDPDPLNHPHGDWTQYPYRDLPFIGLIQPGCQLRFWSVVEWGKKTGCCDSVRGNVDCSLTDGEELVDISDLTALIDHLFISLGPICCSAQSWTHEPHDNNEANIDGIGGVDISDLTALVDHLFINNAAMPVCN